MIYVIAVIAPPLALYLNWNPLHGTVNLVCWLFGLLTAIYGVGLVFLAISIVYAISVIAAKRGETAPMA